MGTGDFETWPDPRQIFSSTALNPRPGFWRLLSSGDLPQTWKEEIAAKLLQAPRDSTKASSFIPQAFSSALFIT